MFNQKKSHGSHNLHIDTLIGEQCTLQGDMSSQHSIKIDGGIIGHVISEGMIIVGEKGWIKGNAQAKELVVFGRIEGDITAQSLDLKASAQISGNIDTHTLQVDSGAVYQGSVRMHSQNSNALPEQLTATPSKALPVAE